MVTASLALKEAKDQAEEPGDMCCAGREVNRGGKQTVAGAN